MTANLGVAAGARPVTALAHDRSRDRWFFTGMAVAIFLTAVIGFSPTYYLRGMAPHPPLTLLVHVHGLVFTAWLVLFVAQTSLVAAGRTPVHRRLGAAAVILVALMLVVGWLTAVEAARKGVTPPGGPPPLAFLSVPLGTLAVFAILVGAGLWNRRRSQTHKRLMLLATISVLTPAIARLRWTGWFSGPLVPIVGTIAFVLVCIAYDRWAHGRIHPAFLWGGLFVIVSLPARFALGGTSGWHSVAVWLTQ